jgi:hypothetical protein
MTMRDKIAGIVWANRQTHNLDADYIADAIIAALPDMTPDLVWTRNGSHWSGGNGHVISKLGSQYIFTIHTISFCREFDTLEEAQTSANAHNSAAGMAIFKGEKT